jgi:hypothetical protein
MAIRREAEGAYLFLFAYGHGLHGRAGQRHALRRPPGVPAVGRGDRQQAARQTRDLDLEAIRGADPQRRRTRGIKPAACLAPVTGHPVA